MIQHNSNQSLRLSKKKKKEKKKKKKGDKTDTEFDLTQREKKHYSEADLKRLVKSSGQFNQLVLTNIVPKHNNSRPTWKGNGE